MNMLDGCVRFYKEADILLPFQLPLGYEPVHRECPVYVSSFSYILTEDLGVSEGGLGSLIRASYKTLGLQTYFTTGEKETRAWTIKKGMTAPQAAGVIHSDLEKGFIRAETVAYNDFVDCVGFGGAKDKGKLRLEGKEYIVQEGDIMLFRSGLAK